MVTAEVQVHLKKGVADPEGTNTLKALKLLGFDSAIEVKSARLFNISIEEDDGARAKAIVEEMCQKLLANPVIHDYTITLKE
ncbi:MAG: phosphoribosylformylglycinamidine synthase subunit PurS [Methanomassiliicoccales archaeon]|nr:MAG: phosphoribosylformylglycinamidine synthase subunit PurS [Methanomassiliicoccales archaeon]